MLSGVEYINNLNLDLMRCEVRADLCCSKGSLIFNFHWKKKPRNSLSAFLWTFPWSNSVIRTLSHLPLWLGLKRCAGGWSQEEGRWCHKNNNKHWSLRKHARPSSVGAITPFCDIIDCQCTYQPLAKKILINTHYRASIERRRRRSRSGSIYYILYILYILYIVLSIYDTDWCWLMLIDTDWCQRVTQVGAHPLECQFCINRMSQFRKENLFCISKNNSKLEMMIDYFQSTISWWGDFKFLHKQFDRSTQTNFSKNH